MSGAELGRPAASDPARLPTLADDGPATAADVDPRASLPRLHRVAQRRAGWLADRLAELVAERGLSALVDDRHALDGDGNAVRVGEDVRALAQLEGAERDRAERIATSMSRLGISAAAVSVATERQGRMLVAVAQEFAAEAGLDWSDEGTKRQAQRAILRAREREGPL